MRIVGEFLNRSTRTIFEEAIQKTLTIAEHMSDGRVLVIRRFSFGIFSFCRVLDSRYFIKRQAKVFRISLFVYLYKFHFVQIFETNVPLLQQALIFLCIIKNSSEPEQLVTIIKSLLIN